MHRFLPYLWKTLWRHRSRTLLTASGSAVALFVFCFVGAVHEGVRDLERNEAAERALVVFQANKFCPATSHLPQDYERAISRIDGVRQVVPLQVFTNNCRASLDVVVFHGVPADQLESARDLTLLTGTWAEFRKSQDAALVGSSVARRRQLALGDKFSIGELTITVAGTYTCESSAEENYIYTHLDFLQRGRGWNRVGTVTQHEVLLDSDADPAAIAQQIDETFRHQAVPTTTRSKGVFQTESLGDLLSLMRMAHYLGYACLGLVLALVANTTLMSVQDRAMEHAMLATLGFSPRRIFGLILCESFLLSLLGGSVGVAAAMLVLTFSQLAVAAEAVTIAFTPSLRLVLLGLTVSTAAGLLGGVIPALQAARRQIVPALRAG